MDKASAFIPPGCIDMYAYANGPTGSHDNSVFI